MDVTAMRPSLEDDNVHREAERSESEIPSTYMRNASRRDFLPTPLLSIINITATDCEFAKEISTSSVIQTLRIAQILACLLGLFSSTLFIYVLCSQTAHHLHVNVRLSLISLTAGAVLACFQLFIIAIYHIIQTFISQDACDYMVDVYICALIRFPILFVVYSTISGSMVLAAERAIATIRFKTYESQGSVYVGIILVAFQWLVALGITASVIGMRLSPGRVHYCSIYIAHPRSAIYSVTVICILETLTLLLSVVLLKINQHKKVNEFINNSLHSLTERYQLQENIHMMQILIPTMIVHAVLSILCLIALSLFAIFENMFNGPSAYGLAPFSEFILLFVSMYGSIFPIFAVIKNAQLRQITRRALSILFGETYEPGDVQQEQIALYGRNRDETRRPRMSKQQLEQESDRHFGLLSEMWRK